jgi:NADH:ubiquinone oxidoreductase subunit 6 (subunit J)
MKLKFLLSFFLLLQLGACQKRYAGLHKIRVPQNSKQEVVAVHKKKNPIVLNPLVQKTYMDSTITMLPAPMGIAAKQRISSNKQQVDHTPPTIDQAPGPKDKTFRQKTVPEPEQPENKHALLAFIFTSLSVVSLLVIFTLPFLGILLAGVFAALAFDFGQKALKKLTTPNENRRWMAKTGVIVGGLLLAAAIVVPLIFVATFSSKSTNNAVVLSIFAGLTAIIYALLLYTTFHQTKPAKPVKPAVPIVPYYIPNKPTPDNWSVSAIASFIMIAMAGIFLLAGALTLLTLMLIVAALIVGIYALLEIHETHQKGKLLALTGVLFVPIVFLIFAWPIGILVALVILTWKLIKRHQRKKAAQASLS